MDSTLLRLYVERAPGFDQENETLRETLRRDLHLRLEGVRRYRRYDIENGRALRHDPRFLSIFAEPQSDIVTRDVLARDARDWILAVEPLPGQYDQRADSCSQCIELVSGMRPLVKTADVYLFKGELSDEDKDALRRYLINPVESREAALSMPKTLKDAAPEIGPVPVLEGFIKADEAGLEEVRRTWGLAMDLDDLAFMQAHFKEVGRDPTETEVRLIDTYWSDHCRHTTFNTRIDSVEIEDPAVKAAFGRYRALRERLYGADTKRPETLMDMATIATKALKRDRKDLRIDESEEVNACSVKIDVERDGVSEPWLYMFKNETHNHPTEIEPFGGAATCLGGAIRDPLSGRAYVYQGCRVTGAADPRKPIEETRPGKLPQKKICRLAARGFSSYGNQIGLATGLVDELYHPGYEAKRMEVGAVIAAAPEKNVVRERPAAGDMIVLVGGRTGRDGCGGATGSSKAHTEESLETAGAEVQKGNAVEERKIQRLFRRPEIARSIKRCNDFGAGGVAVSVGELAPGLVIELDRVPKKYAGLTPTELAISESQERMSCVIDPADWPAFEKAAHEENVDATPIARVTEDERVVMRYEGGVVVDLDRAFLDSAGAPKHAAVRVDAFGNAPREAVAAPKDLKDALERSTADLNQCSKRGLVEHFDSTIGANTVLMPFGGRTQRTPIQVMASKIPLLEGETDTTSLFTYGFDPYVSNANPYEGAYLAVLESVAKLVSAGLDPSPVYLSLQEYFPSLKGDPRRWGRPFAALLGALDAQLDLGAPAIGGKDSMSGSFEQLDVPSTLISFATSVTKAGRVISPELKAAGRKLYRLRLAGGEGLRVDPAEFQRRWSLFAELNRAGLVEAAWAVSRGGLLEGLYKMAFGNRVGVRIDAAFPLEELVRKDFGTIIVCSEDELDAPFEPIGETIEEPRIERGDEQVALDAVLKAWEAPLASVYPTSAADAHEGGRLPEAGGGAHSTLKPRVTVEEPLALIPTFPGTNCEVDTARALRAAGARVETVLVTNRTPEALKESIDRMEAAIRRADFMVFPGGFSFGDEPDGSGKYIATFFRNERLAEAIEDLLYKRDGLILGICNGFQALVKLGLLPYGHVTPLTRNAPTLTFNEIGRHQSRYVETKVCSVASPWLAGVEPGERHHIAISHGEGRFMCSPEMLAELEKNGQVATRYVDDEGRATLDIRHNPNGSVGAVEGLLSPDGRIFGKMGHSERIGEGVTKNIPGPKDQHLFESAVKYFRGH